MKSSTFSFTASDNTNIFVYKWSPDGQAKAAILIAHGMAEHAARYERFAAVLTKAGYVVYAEDHRGHGKTAPTQNDLGYYCDKDGFTRIITDMHELQAIVQKENPNKKVFLFGHSMGSFIAQGFISLYGNELAGCILSGTAGKSSTTGVGKILAGIGCLVKGRRARAPLLNQMSFGSFNDAFKPNRTDFDWLSRDEAEVDKYINDPFCGFICTDGMFYDLSKGLLWLHKESTMKAIPQALPLYMFAGEKDPVGAANGSFTWLANEYKKLGIKDFESKLYKDGRHELLNDLIRDEVAQDCLSWFDKH